MKHECCYLYSITVLKSAYLFSCLHFRLRSKISFKRRWLNYRQHWLSLVWGKCKCQRFWHILAVRQTVHLCHLPERPYVCLCQLNCLSDEPSLAWTLCSRTLPFSRENHRHGSCGFHRLPRRIKTVISNLCRFFHAQKKRSSDSFVHVLAELRFAEVHAFFKYSLWEGLVSD